MEVEEEKLEKGETEKIDRRDNKLSVNRRQNVQTMIYENCDMEYVRH